MHGKCLRLLSYLVSGPAGLYNSKPCMLHLSFPSSPLVFLLLSLTHTYKVKYVLIYFDVFQDDTVNLFSYGILRLTPRILSGGGSTWSYLRKGSASSHAESTLDRLHGFQDNSSARGDSYQIVRPLQHGKWSKGKDGFLVTDIWGVEVGNLVPTTPTIWLQQIEHKMYLCTYQHKSLTILLLIPVTSMLNGEEGISMLKQQLLENVSFLSLIYSSIHIS